MQKDKSSGRMTAIDPKSSLASEIASVTMTRAEMPSDVVKLVDMQSASMESASSSSINVGAAVAVPVAVFFISLLVCLFYRRNPFLYTRHRDAVFHACRWILQIRGRSSGVIHRAPQVAVLLHAPAERTPSQ